MEDVSLDKLFGATQIPYVPTSTQKSMCTLVLRARDTVEENLVFAFQGWMIWSRNKVSFFYVFMYIPPISYIHIHTHISIFIYVIYHKELVHVIMKVEKTRETGDLIVEMPVWVQRQENICVPDWRGSGREREFFLTQTFGSIQAFNGLDEGAPILGRAICSVQSTDSNENLIQKHSHRRTQYVNLG